MTAHPPLLSELIADAADQCDIHFVHEQINATVAELIDRHTSRLSAVEDGSRTAAILTNDPTSVGLILSCIVNNQPIVSLPLPGRGASADDYIKMVADALRNTDSASVIARDDIASLLVAAGIPAIPHSQPNLPTCQPSQFHLVQFSSGTTRNPSPVLLDDRVLGANVSAIIGAVAPRHSDHAVSWLPISHDMGLVGMLLTAVAAASPRYANRTRVTLLRPDDFLRSPATWLETLSDLQGTFTASPDFGLRLATRVPLREDLELGQVRVLITGGEIVRERTLEVFEEATRHTSLSGLAICPAYGMAEIGLCATMTPPHEHWRDSLRLLDVEGQTSSFVSAGRALDGYKVDRVNGSGVGPIGIQTSHLGCQLDGHPLSTTEDWYLPGDIGTTHESNVYVCGRNDDYAIVQGRHVSLLAIQQAVGDLAGIRTGRVVATGLPDGRLAIIAECAADLSLAEAAANTLRRLVSNAVSRACGARPDAVELVERGTLPATSSGKLRRNAATALLRGREASAAGTP